MVRMCLKLVLLGLSSSDKIIHKIIDHNEHRDTEFQLLQTLNNWNINFVALVEQLNDFKMTSVGQQETIN